MAELLRLVRNQLGLSGDQEITLEMFKAFLKGFKDIHTHVRCGEDCPHLKRFYAKLGFTLLKYKRKFLKMKENKISAFSKKLPDII